MGLRNAPAPGGGVEGGCRGGEWSEWAGAGEATVPVSIQSVSNEGSQSLLLPPPSHRPPRPPPPNWGQNIWRQVVQIHPPVLPGAIRFVQSFFAPTHKLFLIPPQLAPTRLLAARPIKSFKASFAMYSFVVSPHGSTSRCRRAVLVAPTDRPLEISEEKFSESRIQR